MNRFVRPLFVAVVAATASALSPSAHVSAADPPTVIISEVHPTGSSNSTYRADWFEITNIGTQPVDITGWKMDDDSNAFASAVPVRGATSIPAGASAVFLEGTATGSTDAALIASFSMAWFGSATPPAGVLIGVYGGSGVGLGSGGDQVNLFDATGARIARVVFGAATPGVSFDNTAGLAAVLRDGRDLLAPLMRRAQYA